MDLSPAVRSSAVGFLMAAALGSANADINMNVLNACADVNALYQSLNRGEDFRCRSARGILERGLEQRMTVNPSVKWCFISQPTFSSLRGTSCMQTKYKGANELFCFRNADEDDIETYKREFKTTYAPRVAKYLDQARTCEASNGDASVGQKTLSPIQLNLIAQFDMGFTVALGTKNPSTVSYLHGYATLDPDLPAAGTTAIEFAYMLVGGNLGTSDDIPTRTVGKLKVALDPMHEVTKTFKQAIERSGVPVAIQAISIDVRRPDSLEVSEADKNLKLEQWLDKLSDAVTAEGFEEVSDRELRRLSGLNHDGWVDRMVSSQPYGVRDDARDMLSDHLKVLVNKKHSCIGNDEGALMAIITGMKPASGVRNNYGAVSVLSLGVASCGRADRYLSRMIEKTSNGLLEQMGNEK